MKNSYYCVLIFLLFSSCKSTFNNFYSTHKDDTKTTSFHMTNSIKQISDADIIIGSIIDMKYIKFENITPSERDNLIKEISNITQYGFKDFFRRNELVSTRIVSVKEDEDVLTDVILFKSLLQETTAFYLKGKFDSETIRDLKNNENFNDIVNQLVNVYQKSLETSIN